MRFFAFGTRSLVSVAVASVAALVSSNFIAPTATADDKPALPQMVAYRWGISPDGNVAFTKWVGADVVWAEDFEASETWDNIQYPGWQLYPWQKWVEADARRRLVLSVPMLPGAWNRSGPPKGIAAKQPVSLAAGARGEYNAYYEMLAKKLVEHKLEKTILRIGWEMNGGWYVWRASDDVKSWTEYFRQIVKTMRAVPGQQFQFVWNPATDYGQFAAETSYPGNEFVDVIGIDVYDQSWGKDTYPIPKDATPEETERRQKKAWSDWIWGGNHGLKFWNDFAQKQQKPMAVCEWGVCQRSDGRGGLDNPYFIEQMHKFITDPANNVLWHCYFDVEAGDGKHQLSPGKDGKHQTLFPKSAAKFLELFGHKPPN